jgi:2-polyprenyl-6-methoxyphenol hydroxylase-like FAD-dependent oxidoreductase
LLAGDTHDIEYREILDIFNHNRGCRVLFNDGRVDDFDLEVPADGGSSAMRGMTFSQDVRPEYVGNVCWRCIVSNSCNVDEWSVMLGRI